MIHYKKSTAVICCAFFIMLKLYHFKNISVPTLYIMKNRLLNRCSSVQHLNKRLLPICSLGHLNIYVFHTFYFLPTLTLLSNTSNISSNTSINAYTTFSSIKVLPFYLTFH